MKDTLFDLSGRVALGTGGSKGLGKAMTRELALAGADIVISSLHEDELKEALDEIVAGTQVRGTFCVADMPQRQDVEALARSALAAMGISILLYELPHQLGLMVAAITAIALTLLFEKIKT